MFRFYRIHLKTRDVVSTAQWYMDHLDARKVEESRRQGNHNILLDVDGIEIVVTQPPKAATMPAAPHDPHIGLEHFGLVTEDLDGLLSRMRARGVKVLELSPPERANKYAFVQAPDGVRLELVQG